MPLESKARIESDRFGTCAIPPDTLWGIQTARSIENMSFSSKSLNQYPELIRNFLLVKKAAATANHSIGLLSDEVFRMICTASDEILSGNHLDQFPVDVLHGGGGIAFNVNLNEVIANLANIRAGTGGGADQPIHPKSHVNLSQSTADVCHTAFRLTLLDLYEPLKQQLYRMLDKLTASSLNLLPTTTIARTCLQDAMPVQLGELFGGYASLIRRGTIELDRAVDQLRSVNLGGTVIGSGDGASEEYRASIMPVLSKLVDKELSHRQNLYDAAQNMDDLARVSSELEHVAQSLSKIARDLRLLSSGPEAGFAEITLPLVQEGSSFFSKKNNPVIPETVINCCLQISGLNRASQGALEQAELYLNVFEPMAAINIIDSVKMLTRVSALFTDRCLSGLEANVEQCARHARPYMPESSQPLNPEAANGDCRD